MARHPSSLRGAHLVMWSSPVLLIVLVLTLGATAHPGPTTTTSSHATSSTTVARAVEEPTTTSPARVRTTSSSVAVSTRSSVSTTTTAPPSEPGGDASAVSGPTSGVLSPTFDVADVPVQGPGTWLLSTSAPTTARLQCGSSQVSVTQQVVITGNETCDLELTSSADETSTWQLTPAA